MMQSRMTETRGHGWPATFVVLALLCAGRLSAQTPAPPSIDSLIDGNHFKRAQAQLATILKQSPNDPQANYQMSKVSIAFGRVDEAIQQVEKALASNNSRADYHAQLVEALGAKLNSASTGFLSRLSLARRFQAEAEATLQMDPRNVEVNTDLMQFYLEAPGMAGGDKAKASALADKVFKLDPAHGYVLKAQYAEHEHQPDEAAQFYQRAAEAAPNDYEIVATAANFFLNLENQKGFPQAEDLARRAEKLNPDRIETYNILSVLYVKQRRWPDLQTTLTESEHHVPDNLSPQYQAGKFILVTAATDQFPLAEKSLRNYLTQPPEAGAPPLAAAHWRLGQILEKAGRRDEARKELQTAVQLEPNLKDAQQDLKRLR
jgi:tetratricopeptide (TPR) repeat protein